MTEEKTDLEILTEALHHAREEFEDYLEDEYGLDPSFFDLKLVGYLLSRDLKPLERVTIHPEFKVQSTERKSLREELEENE